MMWCLSRASLRFADPAYSKVQYKEARYKSQGSTKHFSASQTSRCRPGESRKTRADCVVSAVPSATAAPEGSTLTYTTPEGVEIHILGVEHCVRQPHLGDFIMKKAPYAVVLETSLTREHGSKTGNVIKPTDKVDGPEVFFFRMFNSMANALAKEADPANCKLWGQYQNQLFGEQIAYVAAFCTGAHLIFGDRPKETTYRRLLNMCTIDELDHTFAQQSAANYMEVLSGVEPPPAKDSTVELVMMHERNAILCSSLDKAAKDAIGTGKSVVALVGSAHLTGMADLWESGEWKKQVASSDEQAHDWRKCLWDSPSESADQDAASGQIGVKRALLECVVRLRCTDRLIQDMVGILGPVPEDQEEAYQSTQEIYSTCRMLLAVLDKELLDKVVSGVGCEFHDLLEDLRRIRPSNGGPGWDPELVAFLRSLNFNVD